MADSLIANVSSQFVDSAQVSAPWLSVIVDDIQCEQLSKFIDISKLLPISLTSFQTLLAAVSAQWDHIFFQLAWLPSTGTLD